MILREDSFLRALLLGGSWVYKGAPTERGYRWRSRILNVRWDAWKWYAKARVAFGMSCPSCRGQGARAGQFWAPPCGICTPTCSCSPEGCAACQYTLIAPASEGGQE